MERKRLRKRSRRYLFFIFLLCSVIFASGVLVVNDVMVRMTALSQDENLFSAGNVERAVMKIGQKLELEQFAARLNGFIGLLWAAAGDFVRVIFQLGEEALEKLLHRNLLLFFR